MNSVEKLVATLQKDKELERRLLRLSPNDHAAIARALQQNPVTAAQLRLLYDRVAVAKTSDEVINLLGAALQFGVTLGYLIGKPEELYAV